MSFSSYSRSNSVGAKFSIFLNYYFVLFLICITEIIPLFGSNIWTNH